jgi:tRNA1Val (adenine37-N6)-methyltransferase
MKVTTDGCLFGALVADEIHKTMQPQTILDIGTGTGLLSLMLAQKSTAHIDAIEIDSEAAAQAKRNFTGSPWSDRLHLINQDVNEFKFETRYDVIISNPPFYENELKSINKKRNTALHHEGLLLKTLASVISKTMHENGRFFLLLPYKRHHEIDNLLNEAGLAVNKKWLIRQTTGHDFFRIIIEGKFSQKTTTPLSEEISIKNKSGYTSAFINLLKDYYLNAG